MNHKWKTNQAWGVTNGSGRPSGTDESQTCRKCGASRGSGPQNTASGNVVTRRWIRDAEGRRVDRLPSCE